MRYFQPPANTRFYAGVDLHARALFLVLLDQQGQTRYARNLPAAPQPFRKALQPFRPHLLVACECMPSWYWLADTCRDDHIAFVLGHAWGMKAVHGSKAKCDRKDAEAIARLLKGGNFPLAYAYPKERRGLRDLLRARLRLVRQRAQLYGHVHTARRQLNLPPVSNDVKYKSKRAAILTDIDDDCVRRRVEADLSLLEPLDTTIRRLEKDIAVAARSHYATEMAVLQSTPGVGVVIALTILLEIDTLERFDTRQPFCSYARLCGVRQESAGKKVGVGNAKQGNAWLKWAFSEAAVLSTQKDERIAKYLDKLASRLGKAKALSALAHKLGRAFYHMLHKKEVFIIDQFLRH
jgi:transposase